MHKKYIYYYWFLSLVTSSTTITKYDTDLYEPWLEHTKSLSIIGVNNECDILRIVKSRLLVQPINNKIQIIFLPDTVNFYYHMENLFIHVVKMLRLQAYVTILTNIWNHQSGHALLIVAVNFLVYLFLIHTLITTRIWTFHFCHREEFSSCSL